MSRRTTACALSLLFALGCHRRHDAPEGAVAASAPSAKPLDHLAPGELNQGPGNVFGFAVPAQMHVNGAFLDVAFIAGNVTPEALANYVRERCDADHVEIGAVSTVFSHVHIKGGAPDRVYDFEVKPGRGVMTELVITDVTPRPKAPPGFTNADRWRQAGYGPDGKPLDPNLLKYRRCARVAAAASAAARGPASLRLRAGSLRARVR